MKKILIKPFDMKSDLKEVEDWKKIYENHLGYQLIKHFILDDNGKFTLDKILKAYYEPNPIGKHEKNTLLAIKDTSDNLLGFAITNEYDLMTQKPQLHIDFLVVNPKFQGQGVATSFLTELTKNPTQYLSIRPHQINAIVSFENKASFSVFEKLGFQYKSCDPSISYYRMFKQVPVLEEEKTN